MKIGEEVVLTETVLLAYPEDCQVLPKGCRGIVQNQSGSTVALLCGGTIYSDIPMFALEPACKGDSGDSRIGKRKKV